MPTFIGLQLNKNYPLVSAQCLLEIVGNEALLRFQDRVAYVNLPRISGPKNKITLVFGTTWHELKHVRIWHASANPEWEQMKNKALASREAFTQGPFSY